jgi:hypothetical protein
MTCVAIKAHTSDTPLKVSFARRHPMNLSLSDCPGAAGDVDENPYVNDHQDTANGDISSVVISFASSPNPMAPRSVPSHKGINHRA